MKTQSPSSSLGHDQRLTELLDLFHVFSILAHRFPKRYQNYSFRNHQADLNNHISQGGTLIWYDIITSYNSKRWIYTKINCKKEVRTVVTSVYIISISINYNHFHENSNFSDEITQYFSLEDGYFWSLRWDHLSVYKGDTLRYISSLRNELIYTNNMQLFCLRTLSSLQVFFFLRYVAFKTQNRGRQTHRYSSQLELNRNALTFCTYVT